MVACGAQSGDPEPGTSSSLTDRISSPLQLGIASTDEGSFARLSAVTLRDGTVSEVEVVVVEGSLSISLDESEQELRVDQMTISAADVFVGPGVMPPDGATLTGIAVDLTAPVQASLATLSDTAATVAGGLAIDLRWAVELDHGVVDLAPIRLPELPFELSVEVGPDGTIDAHLTASQPGPFWTWAGIFELRDLELDLVATTGPLGSGPVD